MKLENEMNTFLTKKYLLTKVGSSYKVTLPVDFVKGFGINEGDELTVAIDIVNKRFIVYKDEK